MSMCMSTHVGIVEVEGGFESRLASASMILIGLYDSVDGCAFFGLSCLGT